jgi:hypothetical protein
MMESNPEIPVTDIELNTGDLQAGVYTLQIEMEGGKVLYSRVSIAK